MAVSVAKSVWRRSMRLLLFGFCLVQSGVAVGQLALAGPQPSYEGQNVSAISLIANPHRDLSPLYPLVTQTANSPYSTKEINESAAALKKAGDFPAVRVQVTPEVSGLRVSFLLEPAYYDGVLKFPGAARRFAYIRLLQAADFSEQEPYDPARVSIAEKGLTDFFRHNGYFRATVHGEPEIDDAHEIVNLKFTINMGAQARISSVSVSGPSPAESAALLHSIRSIWARLSRSTLKPGEPYRAGRINAAIRRMKRTLTKQNRLASSIHENPPQYDPRTNRVAVSFKIEVGPTVTVRTIGPRLTWIPFLAGREMKKLIPIYSEGTVDRELVEEGQRNLVDYFQKKGFNDVKVAIDFQKQPDHIVIVYRIDPGTKHKVDRISFAGNHAIPVETLMAQVTVHKSHVWTHGSLSQKVLKQSGSNIEALYRDRGYEQAKVKPQTIKRDGKIDVAFDVMEGPKTTVENVKVVGNKHIPYDQLTAPKGFQLQAGTPFSPRKLADDQNRISATYLDRGYLNAEVKANVARLHGNSERVTVTYEITENQLVRVSDVLYLGQEHTQMSLLKKTTQLTPEVPMRRAQLLEAESQLYDLGIFDWASVGPEKPITDQTESTALVKLHEEKRNEVTYGIGFEVSHRGGNVPTGTVALPGGGTIGLNGYQIAPSQSTFASPRGLIEYTRHNIRGLAETGTASLLLSRLDQKALTSYSQPHFVGSQWKSLSTFSVERNSENPLFTDTLGDLTFQLERLISRKANTRLQFRYDFNKTVLSHILVPDLVLEQDRNVRLSTVSASLIKDTRDHPLDAHHGVFATVDLGITPTAFGSSANFARLFAQYAFYKPVHSVVLANSIRFGLASPFASSFVPTSQLFFSGGGTTLRSFPIDEAGPQRLVPFCNVLQGQAGCVNVTVPVGGKQLFIVNSEVRFPLHITKALGGVVFYDGGNVYSAINFNNFVNNYTSTIGFGLRYATPIGPIRIDVGHNLNPVPGINPTQYYITIGQAF